MFLSGLMNIAFVQLSYMFNFRGGRHSRKKREPRSPVPVYFRAKVRNLSTGNMSKMLVVLKLGVPAPSKVTWSRFVSPQKAVFEAVFWRKSSFWLTLTKCWPPLNIHHWKALLESFHMVFLKNYFMDPLKRQIFRDARAQIFSLILRPCHIDRVGGATHTQAHTEVQRTNGRVLTSNWLPPTTA